MSKGSSIEWTDSTWNPVTGCTKVSPGCDHCYAETFAERFRGVPGHPFEGGFDLTITNPNGTTGCNRITNPTLPNAVPDFPDNDYVPHHQPFQYYASTANPNHLPPSSVAAIGHTDQANHQYDMTYFFAALKADNLPAVSFLKPPGYQDGHPGDSDPLDLQHFLVTTINRLQRSPAWKNMLIVISFDDSGGWYDHVRGPLVHQSATQFDTKCGKRTGAQPVRCGYGPRLPYLVISPYAKPNQVDHTVIDQSSTRHFIEANWLGGRRLPNDPFDRLAHGIGSMLDFKHARTDHLYLNPTTGNP